jgi:ketosteroid isomerase-like protein
MSQENVELVRPIYNALNRRDWEAVFRNAHPDFELTTQRGANAGTYRGHQPVQSFFEDYLTAFDTLVFEPEEFFEGGDQVVAFVTVRAQIKGGSGDLEPRIGHLWTIRGATILSLNTFPRVEDALAAAGLSE